MPRRTPLLVAVVLIVVVVAFVGGAMATWIGGPTRHDSGAGPLGSNDGPRSDQVLALDPVNAGKTYSVAERICLNEGASVVLEDVRPVETLGTSSDWSFLGAQLRMVPAGDTSAFLGVEGYPPAGAAGTLSPVHGGAVETSCSSDEGAARAEIILGFSTPATTSGGGWQALEVTYRQGADRYGLVIHDTWVLCGSATATVPECSDHLRATSGTP